MRSKAACYTELHFLELAEYCSCLETNSNRGHRQTLALHQDSRSRVIEWAWAGLLF